MSLLLNRICYKVKGRRVFRKRRRQTKIEAIILRRLLCKILHQDGKHVLEK